MDQNNGTPWQFLVKQAAKHPMARQPPTFMNVRALVAIGQSTGQAKGFAGAILFLLKVKKHPVRAGQKEIVTMDHCAAGNLAQGSENAGRQYLPPPVDVIDGVGRVAGGNELGDQIAGLMVVNALHGGFQRPSAQQFLSLGGNNLDPQSCKIRIVAVVPCDESHVQTLGAQQFC